MELQKDLEARVMAYFSQSDILKINKAKYTNMNLVHFYFDFLTFLQPAILCEYKFSLRHGIKLDYLQRPPLRYLFLRELEDLKDIHFPSAKYDACVVPFFLHNYLTLVILNPLDETITAFSYADCDDYDTELYIRALLVE